MLRFCNNQLNIVEIPGVAHWVPHIETGDRLQGLLLTLILSSAKKQRFTNGPKIQLALPSRREKETSQKSLKKLFHRHYCGFLMNNNVIKRS